MTILLQDIAFICNIIGAAIIFLLIYGFIIWLLGITIYEFCLAHAYFFKRCYKIIFCESPSKKASVSPFVPTDVISTKTTRINEFPAQSQAKSYVVEPQKITLEV